MAGEVGSDLDVGIAGRIGTTRAPRGPWSAPISSTSHPPGTRWCGAPLTRWRMSSSPSNPPNSARWGSHSRTESSIEARTVGDVRRVGDDQVEAGVAGQRFEPRPVRHTDVDGRPSEPGEVGAGDVERIGVDVGDPDRRARERELVGEREPDRARAGAEIGDGDRRPARRRQRDRHLRHQLGLGSRDQHSRVDGQVELSEAPATEHVLQRLAGTEPVEHGVEMSNHPLRRPVRRASP